MDQFWGASGEGLGAVFGGIWGPKWEGLGSKKWIKIRAGCKKGDFQKTKENPTFFQYFDGLGGSDFH